MASVKGLTIGIGVDTKEFDKGIRKMDRDIRSTSKEVDSLSKALKIEFDAGRFAQAQSKAQQALSQTEEKVKVLRERLKFLEDSGNVNTEEYKKLQSQLVETESKAVLLKRQLQEIKDLKIEELAKKFEIVGGGIEKAGQSFKAFSALAAGLLGGLAAIGLSAVKAGDDIGTIAKQLNISSDALQKWRYVAQQTDVSISEMENGLRRVQMELGKVALGETSKGLDRLGFTAEQASRGMMANFDEIIGRLVAVEDATEQAGLANEIFGMRLGASFLPMLKSGGEGLAELSAEFELLGFISEENIKKLDAFEDVMDRIKYQFELVKNQIGIALLPIMQQLANILEERILPALRKATEWFENLSEEQVKTILSTLAIIAAAAPLLLVLGKVISGVGGLIKMVGLLGKSLTMLMAHPIIAVIAVVVGLLVLMYAKNEEFRDSINNLVGTLASSLAPILKTVVNALAGILNALMPIINLIAKALIPIVNILADVFGKAFGFIAKVVEKVVQGIEWYINGVIKMINFLIKQINKLGDIFGFQIKELEKIVLTGEIKTPDENGFTKKDTTDELVSKTTYQSTPTTIINNDYSDKDIKIEVIVQNYAKDVDMDNLVRQINLKLAEEM